MELLVFAADVPTPAGITPRPGSLRGPDQAETEIQWLRRELRTARHRADQAETEVERLRRELRTVHHAANHDPLTGLPNRRAFQQMGTAQLARPEPAVALLLDLDGFKEINDTLGHAAGDVVLAAVGSRLASHVDDDLAARLGGDEFAALLTYPTNRWRWLPLAIERLGQVLAAPIWLDGLGVRVTASIGVAPVHGPADLAEVLRSADRAMYHAKTTGSGARVTAPTGSRIAGICPDSGRKDAFTSGGAT
jgi:diguanylate cyclase (GGDEF)-like protein